MKSKMLLIPAFLTLAACAHYPDVRPGPNGINRVAVNAESEEDGAHDAIRQANSFCDDRYKKHAVFLDEKNKYVGSMKESDYKTAKTVSKVATAAGSALWVFGGKRESTIGGIGAIGGGIANNALGKGYAHEMTFKCQN